MVYTIIVQAIIQENGEVGDHSMQPEFYNKPIPTTGTIFGICVDDFCASMLMSFIACIAELAEVSLDVHDLENYAYGAPLTGTFLCVRRAVLRLVANNTPLCVFLYTANRPRVAIQSFPVDTTLYLHDGTVLTQSNPFVLYDSIFGGYRVRVRPPLNQQSPK